MIGKITSLENEPERNVKLSITQTELHSEISSPPGPIDPARISHYALFGLQQHEKGLITLTFVLINGERIRFYATESKFDMVLLLDQLDATIGERRRHAEHCLITIHRQKKIFDALRT